MVVAAWLPFGLCRLWHGSSQQWSQPEQGPTAVKSCTDSYWTMLGRLKGACMPLPSMLAPHVAGRAVPSA